MDAAPSAYSKKFDNNFKYNINFKRNNSTPKWLSGEELSNLFNKLITRYPFVSVEDPFAEDGWSSWKKYYATLDHSKLQVIADNLTCTNP